MMCFRIKAMLFLIAINCSVITAPCRAQLAVTVDQVSGVGMIGGAGSPQFQACAVMAGLKECWETGSTNAKSDSGVKSSAALSVSMLATKLAATGNALQLESGKKIDELKNAVAANTAALTGLTSELKQQNELMRVGLRTELLARIDRLPIDLVKDDNAYNLLKQRLSKDLSEVFAPRQ